MGSINLPATGQVYLDAQCLIYSIEPHPIYFPVVFPVWTAAQAGQLRIATSEMSILECLVLPYRTGNSALIAAYEQMFAGPEVDVIPISPDILREAARLRASITRLRTPDAIHAATALAASSALFVTNDLGFRNVPGLPVEVLQDVLARP